MFRASAALPLMALLGCAAAPDPVAGPPAQPPSQPARAAQQGSGAPAAPAASSTSGPGAAGPSGAPGAKAPGAGARAEDSFRPPFEMKEVSEKEWLRATREKLAAKLEVE